MKVLILGYGASGKAAEALARELGYDVEIREDQRGGKDSAAPVEEALGCRRGKDSAAPVEEALGCSRGKDSAAPVEEARAMLLGGAASSTGEAESLPLRHEEPSFAVVSPGVPLPSPLIAECRVRGIPLKSELQFGCQELKKQGWKLLAVTGSKGKSSVVKVVADAINLAGGYAVACGNYGVPVCEVALGCRRGKDSAAPVAGALGCSRGKDSAAPVEGAQGGSRGKDSAAPVEEALGGSRGKDSAAPVEEARAMLFGTTSSAGEAESLPLRRYAVVEVSSFMMETTELPAETFEAAVILNLQEDHLDRHGSVEVYHALKRRLLTMAKTSLCGGGLSDVSGEKREEVSDFDVAVRAHDGISDSSLFGGSYFDNDVLRDNARCAVALMRAAGLDDDGIRRGFADFVPLPHRFQLIATIDGVDYIDDSKATSLAALIAGVAMCRRGKDSAAPVEGAQGGSRGKDSAAPVEGAQGGGRGKDSAAPVEGAQGGGRGKDSAAPVGVERSGRFVRLIAGGLPKGDDPKSVVSILTERVKKVYLIGQCAEAFASAWKSSVDCEICGTMEAAVAAAKRDAVKGDKVLLSPGTASFDQFKSFGERGEVFARLVKKENKE